MVGKTKGEAISKVEIAKYEGKIDKLNAEVAKKQVVTNTKVITRYLTKTNEIEKVVYRNRDVIHNVVPEKYYLTKGWLYAYNQSVLGLPIDSVLAANGEDSGIVDALGLEKINENNGKCLATREQTLGLQSWVKDTKANYEKATP